MSRMRAADALRAAVVADAAEMGSHWFYKPDELKKTLGDRWATPEFHEPPSCPFYGPKDFPGMYESGQQSPYGDEMFTLLDFMKENKGSFPGGEAYARSLYEWAKAYKGRKNHATKLFEENMDRLVGEGAKEVYPECGSDDAEANVFFKVLPIAVKYVEEDEAKYLDLVEQAVRTHQNRDDGVDFALSFARILRTVLGGAPIPDAVDAEKEAVSSDAMKAAISKAQESVIASAGEDSHEKLHEFLTAYSHELYKPEQPEAFKDFVSKTCGFPQSFVVGLKMVLDAIKVQAASEKPEEFEVFKYAVRRNIRAGGDTCGRTPVIVALLAAAGAKTPDDWAKRVARLPDAEEAISLMLA